jgi:3D (Asp-Asp-Asp) domain-containing protein
MQPAGASGLLRFDIGVAATGVQVDTNASYWQRAVSKDITVGDYVAVPRLVASKGLSAATISASYAKVQDTGAQILGGTLDVPIINGGLVKPTLAVRGSYSTLRGVDVYRLNTYGLELFLGKGFGPVTPYGAIGRQRSDARGTIPTTTITLRDKSTMNRYTAGVQFNLLLLRLAVEANQAEARSYGAKVSFGF